MDIKEFHSCKLGTLLHETLDARFFIKQFYLSKSTLEFKEHAGCSESYTLNVLAIQQTMSPHT